MEISFGMRKIPAAAGRPFRIEMSDAIHHPGS